MVAVTDGSGQPATEYLGFCYIGTVCFTDGVVGSALLDATCVPRLRICHTGGSKVQVLQEAHRIISRGSFASTVTHLSVLVGSPANDAEARALAQVLDDLPNITWAEFSTSYSYNGCRDHKDCTPAGERALGEALLRHASRVRTVRASGDYTSWVIPYATKVATLILDAFVCDDSSDLMDVLCGLIRANTCPNRLIFSGEDITGALAGARSMGALVSALQSGVARPQFLKLRGVHYTAESARPMGDLMRARSSVSHLVVQASVVTYPHELDELAAALPSNVSIRRLDVGSNQFVRALQRVVRAVGGSRAVRHLSILNRRQIHNTVCDALVWAATHNPKLTALVLPSSALTKRGRAQAERALAAVAANKLRKERSVIRRRLAVFALCNARVAPYLCGGDEDAVQLPPGVVDLVAEASGLETACAPAPRRRGTKRKAPAPNNTA